MLVQQYCVFTYCVFTISCMLVTETKSCYCVNVVCKQYITPAKRMFSAAKQFTAENCYAIYETKKKTIIQYLLLTYHYLVVPTK